MATISMFATLRKAVESTRAKWLTGPTGWFVFEPGPLARPSPASVAAISSPALKDVVR